MKANSEKTKQSKKATRRVLAGVLCGASVLSLVLSLVMPPISQAIANDAQAGTAVKTVADEGSLGEDAGAGNVADKGDEDQNSDDTEGDETDSSNGVEQGQSEDQPVGELQAEDGEPADGSVVEFAAVNEQSQTSANEITSAADLESKLKAVGENETASFELTQDIECSSTIQLEKSGSNITLDLNGYKIKYKNQSSPLFNITGGAMLTVKDSGRVNDRPITSAILNDQGQNLIPGNYGMKARLTYSDDGIPTKLTYYVTESVASGTCTTETLKGYEADIKGAIVACEGTGYLKLINLYNNGHFNLESGTLTQKQGGHVGNLIYAENGSTVTMNGGYICGADTGDSGAGAGIKVSNNASNNKGCRSTFKMTNGVIAGNSAPSGAGVFAEDYVNASEADKDNDFTKDHPTVEMTGGIITGNYTRDSVKGLGGGILATGGSVTVSGGFITNNKYAMFCGTDGNGDHGGAGLAANNGAHVTISGGQITGNYSHEAGGGVYVTDVDRHGGSRSDMAWLNITGGTIASNVSFRSEGAGIRVGQMVDAMINASKTNPAYITNNTCLSRFDWGGGGIFVQGDSNTASNAGRLFVYNSYISSNTAGGYGGGVAVCPSGKTLVTGTEGTAIFGNTDAGDASNYNIENDKYKPSNNSGNNSSPHISGGGDGKDEDYTAYKSENDVFRTHGHADFFLAAKAGHTEPLAAVIGRMLGGGDAKYSGSKELKDVITIPANGGVQIYQSIGLTSGVHVGDTEADKAQEYATTFITGNYSWDHGGGIMSNGDLYLGQPEDTYAYPSLKLKATKELIDSQTDEKKTLTGNEFTFTVYRKDSNDPFTNGVFNREACTEVGTANNDANGNITFDLGEQFAASGAADTLTYYLVENTGEDSDITYDSAVYEIAVKAKDTQTSLMSVPKKENPNEEKQLVIHNYTIENVSVTKYEFDKSSGMWTNKKQWNDVEQDRGYYRIGGAEGSTTFTNKYTPYAPSGSWTPKATKVVKGGEMKAFTFELAKDENFTNPETVTVDPSKATTDENDNKTAPVKFATQNYELKDLENGSKTFTYYVREKNDSSIFSHYKFDQSVYEIKVVATDDTKGAIDCKVTYKKGTVGSDGNWQADVGAEELNLTDTSTPTFTNTYSTSLPLSGMSGVTLTYLAGAAVLCAAAAWMHIRRKANAKGGERRE
ncbi:MAG: FctA domain-containing protein [Collinsella sp.]|nr:FctA domain-containing protein [Collinsella sp.]